MGKLCNNWSTLLFCLLFTYQLHFGHVSSGFSCVDSERQALMVFKASLAVVDSGNDQYLSTWIGEDCCNWGGITCNNHSGHVEKLDLHDSFLGGELNHSLLKLEHLQYLDLSSNKFSGIPIPPFLGSLKNLRYLNFSGAGFSGEISSHLGNLSRLQHLDLGSSSYGLLSAKNLKWITGLSSLQSLDLSWANLAECLDWFDSINMLPSLLTLNLRSCGLDGTVSPSVFSIVNLTSLVSLDLGENNLNSIFPPWLLKLNKKLQVLRLDGSQLQGQIPSFLNFTSLNLLDLSSNSLNSTSIPCSLCNQSSLISLNLGYNKLQGPLPPCLGNLTSLMLLNLTANNFVGEIPSEIGHLKQLVALDLSFNSFKVSIPSSFGQLTKLETFDLSKVPSSGTVDKRNQVQEPLPVCLGNLTSLRLLNLTNNNFGGEISSELSRLKQLTTLDLSFCSFKFSIPSSFGQLTELKFLYLHHNELNGTVPSTLGELTKLEELDLSFNSLTGELSESHFAKLKSLKLLCLSQNPSLSFNVSSRWIPPFQLREIDMDFVHIGTDEFPNWLQTQREVSKLSMTNCGISGTIPEWFRTTPVKDLSLSSNNIHGTLVSFPPDIHVLDLSKNTLSGPIVLFDANHTTNLSVSVLRLDSNNFTGNIPDYLCNLPLAILSLASNHLTGRIPLCFGNFKVLNVLDLSNNSLSGLIPSTLANVQTLMFLHLDKNKLHGELPSSLKKLIFLLTLDLGENALTGTIPEWIGSEIRDLRFLRLESNNFHGNVPLDLCQLQSLQILNLAQNNLVGQIPRCFYNFTMMVSNDLGSLFTFDTYGESLWNIVKGIELQYSSNLLNLKSISLSYNKLDGEIPNELMQLEGLQSLNLSSNNLSGKIPEKIGNLKNLESLDLSMNQLSGNIPSSLANIDALSYLNLSFNNLSGRIPSGNHFDTLNNGSIYEGNSGLCGKVIGKKCPGDAVSNTDGGPALHKDTDDDDEDEFEVSWFGAGIAPGFAVGLLGVICILHFKVAYFEF